MGEEVDVDTVKSAAKQIPPVTGKKDDNEIAKDMDRNPGEAARVKKKTDEPIDFSSHEILRLARSIRPFTRWVLQLDDMGILDEKGARVDKNGKEKVRAGKAKVINILYIYDERGSYRAAKDFVGDFGVDPVIEVIQRAIVKPNEPMKPALPAGLLVSVRFKRFADVLGPFLDKIPSPFTWRFESEEETRTVKEGKTEIGESEFRAYCSRADESKQRGNEAFNKKDRGGAVEAYTKAIQDLEDALNSVDRQWQSDAPAKARSTLSICYANRAAAWMMEGDGLDADKALADGRSSERWNRKYAKAYYRQAKARVLLNQPLVAEDALTRALSFPELENDNSLVDFLIDLQTNGKGLSEDEGEFKQWVLDLMFNGSGHAAVTNINGEWRRRCDARFEKFKLARGL